MGNSFFAELKRRNVYKVAVAYVIVAWLLIQAASILFPTFDAPSWVMKVFVLVVVLAFVPALIFSWAFEITPEGIKRESEVEPARSITHRTGRKLIAITAVLAVVAAGLLVFQLVRPTGARPSNTKADATASIPEKSIAVLPFDSLSEDKDNAFFAEGVQDEILTRLAKVADLKVIARTSTQKFKSAPENLPDIAKQLGVMNLLEGSVQKANGQVRVNVQLINALTNAHLWADIYDRKLNDIFAVESDIAKTIADTLQAKLTGSEKNAMTKRPTENPEAYELYLKGRYFWNRRTGENLKQALSYFQQAVEKDPSYALAYTGMADCYSTLIVFTNDPPRKYIPAAFAAARRALQLDDELAEAHTALASTLGTDLQYPAAETEFKRALELNPNYATAHQWRGECLQALGKFDQALRELQRARELDPLSLIINCSLASVLDTAGRYDEAMQQVERALALDPNFGVAHFFRGQILEDEGKLNEAIAEYQTSESTLPPAECQGLIACIYARSGRSEEARQILTDLTNRSQHEYVSSYGLAQIHVALGEKEEALSLLEKAYEERGMQTGGNDTSPVIDKRMDPLRNEPRFQKLVARLMGHST
ncbi:MAG: tetratricopeptide repeat protein [Chthoniobacterales bacterium]